MEKIADPISYSTALRLAIVTFPFAYGGIAFAGGVTSDVGDPVSVYAADQEAYDSNLYRLPSYLTDIATLISPYANREDYINTVYAGIDGQWTVHQQALDLSVRANENRFTHNEYLNNTSGNASTTWNWHFGNELSGQVGGDYSHSLASFAETLYLGRDFLDTSDYFGSGRYQLGPHWSVFGGGRASNISHSAAVTESSDFRSQSGNAGIEYATSIDNTFGLEYRYVDGRFPHDDYLLNGTPDLDYREDTEDVSIKYALSDKTLIDASAGYLKRNYTNKSIGAFSGDTWRVSLQWQPTEKTQLMATAWRELQAYLGSQSNYFVSKGVSLTPTWLASDKITMSLGITWDDQNYINSSPSVLALGSRHDELPMQRGSVIYTPLRELSFTLSYAHQQRKSSFPQFQYDDELINATVKFIF